ncbi:Predicted lactoylglutathione lyase [Nocardioides sp. YR527]|nr:Predicted lactoylglutathione lyase [Nocardioides sp. YR527]
MGHSADMDYRLELLVLPVSDVDRAKAFYHRIGFREEADYIDDGFRVVQLTPPGSPTSIIIGRGITGAEPGSVQNLHLVVTDIERARRDLLDRGVEVSEIFHDAGGVFPHAGTAHRLAGLSPGRRSYASFASFADPDGNGFLLQEVSERAS